MDPFYGKPAIFDPTAITAMNYVPGCHKAAPEGRFQERVDPALKLLHFKFLGFAYVSARHAALGARMGAFNRERGYGNEYAWDAITLTFTIAKYRNKSSDVPLIDA